MFPIVEARTLAPDIRQLTIFAPRIARRQKPGQFVIVRVHERGERIPLTIAAADPLEGHITIIVQAVGKTTALLNLLRAGDALLDVVGPLGKPSEMENFGTAVVIGGGVGTAIAFPTAKALKQAGNHVIFILGARNKELLLLENEIRAVADELIVMTDDGSYGTKGFVTDALKKLLDEGQKIDHVLAIGPIPMMKAVAGVTRPLMIKTVVSLNSIMVDGTGMCGGCRVGIDGDSQFACVDGPEFDAHQVDFDLLTRRNRAYRELEVSSMADFTDDPMPDIELMRAAGQLGAGDLEPIPARLRSVAR
ncbi:MAG TPA: sulfide/dihydroorotate dehydrogenase-like FAD/NAD-binding protein [Terriglobales bacterium]|jgi:ferredoxin--NADP+ reductase|nr:sulfide/dihydroorotate dehydrogenase-like FAD/NAD-binding protein [Terriglobales bacterium]